MPNKTKSSCAKQNNNIKANGNIVTNEYRYKRTTCHSFEKCFLLFSGLDDARNTARLAWRLICDGSIMQITKSIDGVNT